MAALMLNNGGQLAAFHYQRVRKEARFPWPKGLMIQQDSFKLKCPISKYCKQMKKGIGVGGIYPHRTSPNVGMEILDAWDDEYDGVIIDPQSLPSTANAFASALRASLANWKIQGRKGIWLKILQQQADLVPIAIQEGFSYHHAEPGYIMLTYWIPDEPSMLPASPSHQIGVAGFVMNPRKEILVVKERLPYSCSNIWKLPTGYINKSEDIFAGAVREVKEETGIETIFLEMVAFRHVHLVAFEKSDLLFVCMLKPLSHDITIDDKEIQAAKWMHVGELIEQPLYGEDEMSRKVIDTCIAACEDGDSGFTAHYLASKLDGKPSHLYYHASNSLHKV